MLAITENGIAAICHGFRRDGVEMNRVFGGASPVTAKRCNESGRERG